VSGFYYEGIENTTPLVKVLACCLLLIDKTRAKDNRKHHPHSQSDAGRAPGVRKKIQNKHLDTKTLFIMNR
jgi:hypothetical protein